MITKHAWFEPKRIGWGWRPVSWQGWLITFLFAAVVIVASIAFGGTPTTFYVSLAAVAALVAVCLLTGTRPG
jgi:peptidoglycan/LPS O-acetylase OafA/YrhL